MKIISKPADVTITFSPKEYCLMKCKDEMMGDYSLHCLIDRSEKGKGPDLGIEVLYLSNEEADVFKKAGFSEYKSTSSVYLNHSPTSSFRTEI